MNKTLLQEVLEKNNQPKFRLNQILKAIYQDGVSSYRQITTLPKNLIDTLEKEVGVLSFDLYSILGSGNKEAYKAALKLRDGKIIETVLMSPKKGLWTACISSQVGCPVGCSFCATGLMGFGRNLTVEEITDQVLFWIQFIKKENLGIKLNNIVYMGMGEPFANQVEVFQSIKDLTNPELFNFGDRHISVSTAGIVSGIEKFADLFPQVNLAISLHAANDELRQNLVPINKAYPIKKLMESLEDYLKKTKRKIFIEYVMLDGENDKEPNAKELVKLIKNSSHPNLFHVNLIPFNKTETPHKEANKNNIYAFKKILDSFYISNTIRKSLGREIMGACGQLAGDLKKDKG